MKILNLTNNKIIADNAERADTFLKRLIGLLDRASLGEGQALILEPSNCIHMFFMRFAIDVLFLDKKGKIVATLSSFKPWRLSRIYFESFSVIELPAEVIEKTMTKKGDVIRIIE